jgi:hypothetical protein
MAMKYRQIFRVEGSGRFPYDMLRYDCCFPRHESESPLLNPDDGGKFRQVELMRFVEFARQVPTSGRWESFCWRVIDSSISTEKL